MKRFSLAARDSKTIVHGLGAVVTILALSSCARDATPTPTPSLPSDATRALVIGVIGSPVYDGLKKSVRMVSYDGSQDAADYDMVIFDGDVQTPKIVRDNELIRVAMRSHRWVLGVDVTAAHKRTGLGDYLLAATKGISPGYLARITEEPNGHVGTQVLELPAAPKLGGAFPNVVQTLSTDRRITVEGVAQYVHSALRQLNSKSVQPLQNDNSSTVPDYVNYYPFYLTQTIPWTASGAQKANKTGTQSGFYQVNYSFEVFLDSATNDAGDFQWVSARIDGEANPTNGTNQFVNRAKDEQAWFQDKFLFSVTPTGNYDSQFASYGSSPENQNGVTTVTSGVNFTVGLNPDGPNASFGYNYSQQRTITDWQITNESSDNLMSWYYRSNNPYNADNAYERGNGFDGDGYPDTPTDLSLNTLSTHAQGVWNTQAFGIVSSPVDFDLHSEQHVADAYCSNDLGPTCRVGDADAKHGYVFADNIFSINMSAVVPIDKQLALSEDTVTAGDSVSGTITLASDALRDTEILLSGSANATVPDSVTIPQGGTEASFAVATNASGIASGGNVDATITAYYGAPATVTLTVENP